MPKPSQYTAKDGRSTWKVRFRIGTISASETFATKKDANRFCKLVEAVGGAKARAIINETKPQDVMKHMLGDVADEWLAWKSRRRPDGTYLRVDTAYTIERYEQIIRLHIKTHLGGKPLNLVSDGDVQNWVDDLSDNLKPKTVADCHSVLHQIYTWAADKQRDYAIVDPCSGTSLPKKGKRAPKGIQPAEWKILHAAALQVDQHAADVLLFLVSSGWRWSEAVAVRSMDVDDYGFEEVDGEQVDLGLWVSMGRVMRRAERGGFEFVDDAKSQAGIRRIKMSRAAAAMIRRRREGLGNEDLIFTNPQGRKWYYSGFHDRFWSGSKRKAKGGEPARDDAGKRKRILPLAAEMGLTRHVELHMLRHTHAALMLITGESMAAVQKRLGHEDIRTTVGTYGSMVSDVSDSGLDAMDKALSSGAAVSGLATPRAESIEPAGGDTEPS